MQITHVIQTLRQWISDHTYGASVLGALALVSLLVGTNGFAGVRHAIQTREERAVERRLARQAADSVWCITRFTTKDGKSLTYGHFPGYRLHDVVRFHATSSWLLKQEQQTDCFPTWQRATQATAELAEHEPNVLSESWQTPPRRASEAVLQQAVLAAFLDAAPTSYRRTGAHATEEAPDRWCMSRLRTTAYTVYYAPHPPGGREAVEAVLEKLPDRTHLTQYRIDETACFASAADAEVWLRKQPFVPPADTTLAAYVETVAAWLGEEAKSPINHLSGGA